MIDSGSVHSFSELGRGRRFLRFGHGSVLFTASAWAYSWFLPLGFRSGFTPCRAWVCSYSVYGFGLGLIVFRVSVSFELTFHFFSGIGVGIPFFRFGPSFTRVSVWAYSFLSFRPGFDRFGGFRFLSSIPFVSCRYRVGFTPIFVLGLVSSRFRSGFYSFSAFGPGLLLLGFGAPFIPFTYSGFGLGLLLLRLRPGFTPFSGFGLRLFLLGIGTSHFKASVTVGVYSFSLLLCSFIRVSVSVYSSYGFGLGLLLLGFRALFIPFRDSGFGLGLLLLGLRPGPTPF